MAQNFLENAAKLREKAEDSSSSSSDDSVKEVNSQTSGASSSENVQNVDDVIHSQFIYKQSKHLKQWRKRWAVLSKDRLCTYKEEDLESKPTMNIHIDALTKVESSDQFTGKEHSFDVHAITDADGSQDVFSFRCDSHEDKEKWMASIKEARTEWEKQREIDDEQGISACCSIL